MPEGEPTGNESGQEFRAKFEATQAENGSLRNMLAEQLGVDVEALKGVPADQLVVRANEIKQQQAAQEEQILRKALGLGESDDLEAALAKVRPEGGNAGGQQRTQVADPFKTAGQLGGTPPGTVPDTSGLRGRALIKAGILARNNRNS